MVAAGVTTQEIDLSARVASFPGAIGAIVIPAKKGPVNVPTLVTNETQFLQLFTPNSRVDVGFDLSHFSALNFIPTTDQLYVVRAANNPIIAAASVRTSSSPYNNFGIAAGVADPEAYVFDSGADVPAVAEISTVTAIADSGGSLNNKYFFLNTPSAEPDYYVWFNVNAVGVDPAVAGRTGVEIALATNASANDVASAIQAAVDALSEFSASALGGVATITNATAGDVVDLTSETSGFTVAVSTQGADAISTVDESILFYASSPGAWGSGISIKITNYATDPNLVQVPGAFLLQIFVGTNLATPVESFICSRNPAALDGFGANIFVENALQSSAYLRALSNEAVDEAVSPKDQSTALALLGGSDGLAVTESNMVTAAETLRDKDKVSFNLFMDGGYATPAYQQTLISICQERYDSVAILSVPISAEASASYISDILDYRRTTLNANTSFAALYSPHVRVFDKFNDRRIFVSPDGFAAGVISAQSNNQEIWFPPAGFNRGVLTTALDLRRRYTAGELAALYQAGINPLRFVPGKGIVVWGQKTLLAQPSALDRLNVRLMLIVVEPAIEAALENFVFEFNDEATRGLIVATVTPFLDSIQARRGFSEYLFVCDTTNNTAGDIDANKLNADLFVRPNKAAEFIRFRTIVTSTGLSFDQAAEFL